MELLEASTSPRMVVVVVVVVAVTLAVVGIRTTRIPITPPQTLMGQVRGLCCILWFVVKSLIWFYPRR